MSKPKGYPKTGGRVKGSRNVASRRILERLDEVGFSVPDHLLELFSETQNDFLKFNILKLLAEFSFTKPTPLEPGESDDEPIDIDNVLEQFKNVSDEDLIRIAQREKKDSE